MVRAASWRCGPCRRARGERARDLESVPRREHEMTGDDPGWRVAPAGSRSKAKGGPRAMRAERARSRQSRESAGAERGSGRRTARPRIRSRWCARDSSRFAPGRGAPNIPRRRRLMGYNIRRVRPKYVRFAHAQYRFVPRVMDSARERRRNGRIVPYPISAKAACTARTDRSRLSSSCARLTKLASNGDGATYTPRASSAWNNRA